MRPRIPSRARARRAERGSALPLVLVFVVVIGALVAALLSQASTNFRSARVAESHQAKVYAANSALEWATQQVRSDPTLCATPGSTAVLSPPDFNDRDVHVECEWVDGSSTGAGGWTIFTTGTGNTVTIRCDAAFFGLLPCQQSAKRIVGPVYNNGTWNINQEVTVQDGFVVQNPAAGCTQPPQLRFSPFASGVSPSRFRCAAVATPPAPWSLSELAPGGRPAAAPAATGDSNCRIWSPGTYTSMSFSGAGQHYLRSGVYVLDNATANIPINVRVVGGRPNNGTTGQVGLSGACLAAQQADANNGVVFILRGSASIGTLLGSFELNAYRPAGGDVERAPISVYQLSASEASSWGGPAAGAFPANALSVDDFSFFNLSFSERLNARLSLQGAVYTPSSGVSIAVYETVAFPISGGVVARSFRMELGPFEGGSGEFGVAGGLASQHRTLDLDVTVMPSSPGAERPILGHAQVIISSDSSRSVSVASWRIDEDTDLSTPLP